MRKGIILLFLILIFIVTAGSLFAYDSGNLMFYQYTTIFRTTSYTHYDPFSSSERLWINAHTWIEIEVNLPYAMQAYLTFYGEFDGSSQPYEDLKATLNGGQTRCWYENDSFPDAGWWQFTVPEPFNFQAGRNTIHITHPWWEDQGPGGSIHFNGSIGNGWFRITTFMPSRGLLRLAFLPGACAQRMDLRKVKITKAGTEKDL